MNISRLLTIIALAGLASESLAVQFTVTDISKQVVSCNSPLLANARPGSCLVVPDGTLWMTASLEPNDKPNALDDLYIAIESGGQYFQYQPMVSPDPSALWQKIPGSRLQGVSPFMPSFQRFPFETNVVGRKVSLGQFSSQKGAKFYVGARANDSAGFTPGSVKELPLGR